MSGFKQNVKIIFLFVLLFAVVFLPVFYTEYNQTHTLNQVVTYPVQQMEAQTDANHSYNIWERIQAVQGAVVETKINTQDLKTNGSGYSAEDDLRRIVEDQLAAIQKQNALPELFFSDQAQASVSQRSYVDLDHTELAINVWSILLEYPDYYIQTYMDAETFALYQVVILLKNSDITISPKLSANGFLEYLKTFSEIPSGEEEIFSANGFYGDRMIYLNLSSVNKENGKYTVYYFGDATSNQSKSLPIYEDIVESQKEKN